MTTPMPPPTEPRCNGQRAPPQRFAVPMPLRGTVTTSFHPFDGFLIMKPKLSIYLSGQRRKAACASGEQGQASNKSAIVDSALDRFLNPERDSNGDAALMRRLDRMSRQLDRFDRDLSITAETIALFIRYYLTITPPLPSGDQDAARALGRQRFQIFVAQIGKRVASGGRLVTEVMEKVSQSNPDLFVRNSEEGAPLGKQTPMDDTRSRAADALGEPPEHSPAKGEEVGNV